ncbi:hypothetical protein OK074_7601 [Actinobacteria bacterium OK074]|nr:hypothetical protein OK074_7601 [Actinobacteria bacterium OK074]
MYENDVTGLPVSVVPDRTARVKIIGARGPACGFCHNEGTPVAGDNTGRRPGEFTGTPGKTGRVSVYLRTNGADFLPGRIEPDADFALAPAAMRGAVEANEVHRIRHHSRRVGRRPGTALRFGTARYGSPSGRSRPCTPPSTRRSGAV